jgi:hypothetical protein
MIGLPVFTRQLNDFNDPGSWNSASCEDSPIDKLEPLEDTNSNDYREASLLFLKLLGEMDTFMSQSVCPRRAWTQISLSLGLYSTYGRTLTQCAKDLKISKSLLSKGTTAFLRLTGLPSSWTLKSTAARMAYQDCH